ncbi:PREDICTED: butyrophilin subfamily 1 member A1-like [Condylura cristata]|uniref:butyrophilin subfamily 1 member A1-like n=1 Tax=Condylura cristata TaxID=143302 RepID=UPI000643C9D6|nr:PREDICTED: butyrophilin subfamily 1 member A1-like [Condylura cristata]
MGLDQGIDEGIPQHHEGEVCAVNSSCTRRDSFSVPESSPFFQGSHFMAVTAGQKEIGSVLSAWGSSFLAPMDFTWVGTQTSLLLLLGFLLMSALGFIWKLHWEKEQECQTKEKLQRELSWRKAQEVDVWRKARSYAASVTLDPDTAHFELFLSEDHRSVRRKETRQNLPEKPERFSVDPCVLGREVFSSGRHYWEVEVGNRTYWELGVCEKNRERERGIRVSPQNGIWSVELYAHKCQALTSPPTPLPLSTPPSRVGIFLDYEAGAVSFFSAADGAHIYTFPQASFSGPLHPFFGLWLHDPAPLTICH